MTSFAVPENQRLGRPVDGAVEQDVAVDQSANFLREVDAVTSASGVTSASARMTGVPCGRRQYDQLGRRRRRTHRILRFADVHAAKHISSRFFKDSFQDSFFRILTNLSAVVSLSMRSAVRLSAERMRPCGILAPLERRHCTCGVGSPLTPHSNTASRPTSVVTSDGALTIVGRTEIESKQTKMNEIK